MVMQDRLTAYINKDRRTDILLSDTANKSLLFSIKETDYLSLCFETNKESKLFIECFQAEAENREVLIENGFLACNPLTKYRISGSQLYYLPGYYRIEYESGTIKKHFLFQVEHISQVSKDGFDKIIEHLEGILKGLVYNRQRDGMIIYDEDLFFPLYHNLKENYNSFQRLLRDTLFSMKEDIKTTYVLSSSYGKQDAKSIRKNLIHQTDGKQYIKKKILTYDTLENRLICYSLREFQRKLDQSISLLTIEKNKLHVSVSEDKESYDSVLKMQEEKLFSDRTLINKQLSLESTLQDKNERTTLYEELYSLLCSYQRLCSLFFNDKRIKTIQSTYTPSFFKDDKAKKVKEIQKKIFADRNVSASYRPASQLFEFYGYYMIHSALLDLGYVLEDTNVDNYSKFKENQSYFCYENEKRIIKVLYGPFCENFLNVKKKEKTVSINSNHCSPDFILEFYDKETNLFLKDIVLEVKYIPISRFDNSESFRKDIVETASDYLQLGYISKSQLQLGVVKKVFLLFPSKEEKIIDQKQLHYIYLLGMNVEKDVKDSLIYQYLKSNFEG